MKTVLPYLTILALFSTALGANLGSIYRPPVEYSEYLYISDQQIYEFPSLSKLTSCTIPPHPLPGLSGAVAGLSEGSLVICGGYADSAYQSSCHSLTTSGWEKTASLPAPAFYAAVSQSPGGLLVTGGHTGSVARLATTQTFSGGRWTPGPAMPVGVYGHCQVSVGSSVIIAGGWTAEPFTSGVTTAAYSLEGGKWRKLSSMRTPRYYHACTVFQEELYVIGGKDTPLSYTHTVDIFNIDQNTWREGPTLPFVMRSGVQSVVTAGSLKLIGRGGWMEQGMFQLAEGGNEWIKVADIEYYGDTRLVYPAPVVTSQLLKC